MKRIVFALLLFFSGTQVFSQAQDKGVFSLSVGYDGGAHFTMYDSKSPGGATAPTDSSGAATNMGRLNFQYNILKFLSVGLDMRTGSYLEDPENAEANGNKVSMFGLSVRLYPVNKDKFVWYAGFNFGASRLEINRILFPGFLNMPVQYKFKSPHTSFETGFNWYFAKSFGLNFGLGYSGQKFLMTEYYLNNQKQELSNWENVLTTKGVHVNLGLAFHFGGK